MNAKKSLETSSKTLKKNVTAAAVIVLMMNLVTKLLGFVREVVVAQAFGATMFTDAYVVAYTLPYSTQQIIGSAIVSVTVPLLTKYIVEQSVLMKAQCEKLGLPYYETAREREQAFRQFLRDFSLGG